VLAQQGVRYHIIPRGLIEPPQLNPASSAKWTWRATPGGQFIPIKNS
jgi:hypothetical protein